MKPNVVKKTIITTLFIIAACMITVFSYSHQNVYEMLCPVDITVFICGLLFGWQYGLACAIFSPIISFLLIGIPDVKFLIATVIEYTVFGVVPPLIMKKMRFTKSLVFKLYSSIVPSIIFGRGIAFLFQLFIVMEGTAPIELVHVYLYKPFIGIILQLTLLPVIYFILDKLGITDNKPILENETDYYFYEDNDE